MGDEPNEMGKDTTPEKERWGGKLGAAKEKMGGWDG